MQKNDSNAPSSQGQKMKDQSLDPSTVVIAYLESIIKTLLLRSGEPEIVVGKLECTRAQNGYYFVSEPVEGSQDMRLKLIEKNGRP